MALKINSNHQYDYLRNIKTVGLKEWAKEYGFELDELAWIQPGYPSQKEYQSIDGGTYGTVIAMSHDDATGRTYVVGDFDEMGTNHIACGQVAFIENLSLFCISSNIDASITSMVLRGTNDLVVAGQFWDQGTLYSLGFWNGAQWTFDNIPSDEGGIGYVYEDLNSSTGFSVAIEDGVAVRILYL